MKNGWYLLVDGRWRSRIGDGLHRYLRYEANAQQVLREGAGVISQLGVGTLLGSDTRHCLRCEDNTRHVHRRGAGVVDLLWSDSRRGVASCLAMVALSPPPPARRVAGQTRVFLFRRGRKSSSSSPSPGEPTTVVVAVLRGEEHHIVAAVEGHELETPKAEHRPGLKRLLKATHLELNGKVFVNTQQAPYLARQLSAFWTREDRQPISKFVTACPCPDGLMQDGTQEGNEAYVILHRGARSRGYKRCGRAGARERERKRGFSLEASCLSLPLPCLSYSACLCSSASCARVFVRAFFPSPWKALDIPFYRYKEMPSCTMGV
jgi:hypothetical protein